MSKDIRSFFKIQGGSKSKPTESLAKKTSKLVISDDDDVIPESPDIRHKEKKRNKKRRIADDSSDEDILDSKSNKKPSLANGDANKPQSGKNIEKPRAKEVSAADMFGSGPIKRTDVPTKAAIPNKSSIKDEIEIHSDEDFEKTILQLEEPSNLSELKNDVLNQENISTAENKIENNNSTNLSQENSKHLSTYKIKENGSQNKINDIDKKLNGNTLAQYKIPKKLKTDIVESILSKSPTKKESPVKRDSKRDFSEFLEIGSDDDIKSESTTSSKSKKRKHDQSLNESVISDEERFEKKRHSAMLYKNYLNRTGPTNLGSKAIPEGEPNCLKDLAFVLTGVLSSFEKEDISEAIHKYGGTVKSGVSKKVTHVLAGDDAGPAKLAKAEELGLKIINEDQFLDLIKQQSGSSRELNANDVKREKYSKKDKEVKKETVSHKKDIKKEKEHIIKKQVNGDAKKLEKERDAEKTPVKDKEIKVASFYKTRCMEDVQPSTSKKYSEDVKPSTSRIKDEPMDIVSQSSKDSKSSTSITSIDAASLMWVEKYRPKTLKQIIGQNGDASIVKKLSNWLMRWYINRKEKLSKPSPWAKNDDGGFYKAALLSGPPGIGKTTTVSLVCAELGFDVVELNASDTRSKTLVRDQISELLTTTSLAGYVSGQAGRKAVTKKHVLVMDEVDGMAGNEDRGGLQELISLIKRSSVPIVCMCNDRNSTKMRSLVNYCYDLKFSRPRVDQIKSAMMSVCFKEGLKIAPDALTRLIVSAGQDVRQTLNLLSMWSASAGDELTVRRDVKLGPWEAVRKVFSAEEHKSMSIHDKCDLFFYDYSIAPLFVQENYLQVVPHCPKEMVLKRVSRAADSISLGDTVEAKIRGASAWGLLPVQAVLSSALPGHALAGHVAGQIQFPGWLGRNSRAGKMQRLAQEIHAHTRLSASGSKSSIFLDYCTHLRDAIVQPLIRERAEGIPRALAALQAYHLLREDLDSLTELALWPGTRDPMLLVDSKVKAAMTRAYNKEAATLPYAQAAAKKARAAAAPEGEAEGSYGGAGEAEGEETERDSDSEPESDAMIRVSSPLVLGDVQRGGGEEGAPEGEAEGSYGGAGEAEGEETERDSDSEPESDAMIRVSSPLVLGDVQQGGGEEGAPEGEAEGSYGGAGEAEGEETERDSDSEPESDAMIRVSSPLVLGDVQRGGGEEGAPEGEAEGSYGGAGEAEVEETERDSDSEPESDAMIRVSSPLVLGDVQRGGGEEGAPEGEAEGSYGGAGEAEGEETERDSDSEPESDAMIRVSSPLVLGDVQRGGGEEGAPEGEAEGSYGGAGEAEGEETERDSDSEPESDAMIRVSSPLVLGDVQRGGGEEGAPEGEAEGSYGGAGEAEGEETERDSDSEPESDAMIRVSSPLVLGDVQRGGGEEGAPEGEAEGNYGGAGEAEGEETERDSDSEPESDAMIRVSSPLVLGDVQRGGGEEGAPEGAAEGSYGGAGEAEGEETERDSDSEPESDAMIRVSSPLVLGDVQRGGGEEGAPEGEAEGSYGGAGEAEGEETERDSDSEPESDAMIRVSSPLVLGDVQRGGGEEGAPEGEAEGSYGGAGEAEVEETEGDSDSEPESDAMIRVSSPFVLGDVQREGGEEGAPEGEAEGSYGGAGEAEVEETERDSDSEPESDAMIRVSSPFVLGDVQREGGEEGAPEGEAEGSYGGAGEAEGEETERDSDSEPESDAMIRVSSPLVLGDVQRGGGEEGAPEGEAEGSYGGAGEAEGEETERDSDSEPESDAMIRVSSPLVLGDVQRGGGEEGAPEGEAEGSYGRAGEAEGEETERDSDSEPESDAMIRKKKKPASSSKEADKGGAKGGKEKKGKGKG